MIGLQSVSSSLIGVSPVPDLSFAHHAITGRGRIKLIAASLRSAQSFTRVLFVPDPIVLETACEWVSFYLFPVTPISVLQNSVGEESRQKHGTTQDNTRETRFLLLRMLSP